MTLHPIHRTLPVLALVFAGVAGATTIAVPAPFHGVWGTAASCKAWVTKPSQRLGAPDDGVVIQGDTLEFSESSCVLKRIGKSEADHLQGTLTCSGEGDDWSRRIDLTVSPGGTLKIDKGANLKKCQ